MNNVEVEYLKKTIEKHIRIHFHQDVVEAYKNTQIIWMKTKEIESLRDIKPGTIIIPVQEKETPMCYKSWTVNFRKTKLILWDRLKQPNDEIKSWLSQDIIDGKGANRVASWIKDKAKKC